MALLDTKMRADDPASENLWELLTRTAMGRPRAPVASAPPTDFPTSDAFGVGRGEAWVRPSTPAYGDQHISEFGATPSSTQPAAAPAAQDMAILRKLFPGFFACADKAALNRASIFC